MDPHIEEALQEFRHREFLAWYEDHLETANDVSEASSSHENSPREDVLLHRSNTNNVPLKPSPSMVASTPSASQESQSAQRNAAVPRFTSPKLKRSLTVSTPLNQSSSQDSARRKQGLGSVDGPNKVTISSSESSSKRSRIGRQVDSIIETQSSIFSGPRWNTDILGEASISASVPSQASFDGIVLERTEDGWDERWSSPDNRLLCEWSDDAALMGRMFLSLVSENVQRSNVSRTFLEKALLRESRLDEDAPGLARLCRRALHRLSQRTQTAAAPLSALQWLKRSRETTSSILSSEDSLPLFQFGFNKDGVGAEVGRQCYDLNQRLYPDLSTGAKCGWMMNIERDASLKCLEKVLGDYTNKCTLTVCSEESESGLDSLDLVANVDNVGDARLIANRILTYHGEHLKVKELVEAFHPLCLRVIGVWQPPYSDEAQRRYQIMDVKFIISSPQRNLAKEYFAHSPDAVADVVNALLKCVPHQELIMPTHIGWRHFSHILRHVSRRAQPKCTFESWEQILRFITDQKKS